MAIRYAVANGNWSNTATWDGGILPTSSDDVYANNFTVTINGTFMVLTIRNTANTTPAITAGGQFKFANGGNLTCTASNAIEVGSTTPTLLYDLSSGNTATFNGNVISLAAISGSQSIRYSSNGTFNIVGNFTLNNQNNSSRRIFDVTGTGIINHIGDIISNQSQNVAGSFTIFITANCTYNHTGNCTGGATNVTTGVGVGIYTQSPFTYNQTGNQIAGTAPSFFTTAGSTLNIIGNTSGVGGCPAIINASTPATIDLLGVTTSGSGSPAVSGLLTTFVKVRGNVVHTDTYAAIYAGRVVIDNNVTSWQFKDSTNTITRTLYTPGVALGNPATSNVRNGVTYGASGELTGTLVVPNPSNVLLGVPTDNTTGTYSTTPTLIATEIFTKLLSSSDFNTSGSFGKLEHEGEEYWIGPENQVLGKLVEETNEETYE